MSFGGFGVGVGDVVVVATFAWNIYKACTFLTYRFFLSATNEPFLTAMTGKDASGGFEEVAHEVVTLHTALKELEDETRNPESILNRSGDDKKRELEEIVKNCRSVLQQLEKLLSKYKSLGTDRKRVWDRIKFGREGLQDLREKLTFHTSAISLLLATLGSGSLGRIEKKLDEIVQEIRSGRRAPSVLTSIDPDNEDAEVQWNSLKAELVDDGFTRQDLEMHKQRIREYLEELVNQNDIGEMRESQFSDETGNILRQSTEYSTQTDGYSEKSDVFSDGVELPTQGYPLLQALESDRSNMETHSRGDELPERSKFGDKEVQANLSSSLPVQLKVQPDEDQDVQHGKKEPSKNIGLFQSDKPGIAQSSEVLRKKHYRACQRCRRRKIKCSGVDPCELCKLLKIDCIYTSIRSTKANNHRPTTPQSLPPPNLKRNVSAFEEYREDTTEYDHEGRVRKHTVVRRSCSNSPDSGSGFAHVNTTASSGPYLYGEFGSSSPGVKSAGFSNPFFTPFMFYGSSSATDPSMSSYALPEHPLFSVDKAWTRAEDALLVELVNSGMDYPKISENMPGRDEDSCRLRYSTWLAFDEERKDTLAGLYERYVKTSIHYYYSLEPNYF